MTGYQTYDNATELALFVWQNCVTDLWTMRASGGSDCVFYQDGKGTFDFQPAS